MNIQKVQVIESNWFIDLLRGNADAITFGNTIYPNDIYTIPMYVALRDVQANKNKFVSIEDDVHELLAHELYHCKDYQKRGWFALTIDWFKGLRYKYSWSKPLETHAYWFGKYVGVYMRPSSLYKWFNEYPMPDATNKEEHLYDWLDAHDIWYGGLRYTKRK